MPEDYLQTAFEIKTTCDELSRRLLRWHWEKKPGAHTLRALQQHLEQRTKESPLSYEHVPELDTKGGWQQMDTTFCMRILLDSEEDAAAPLDLLGYAPKPGLARRACNGLRIARNAAAHAGARAGAIEACGAFADAVNALEQAYENVAFTEEEILKYRRLSEEYSSRCGRASAAPKSAVKEYEMKQYATGAERERAAAARSGAPKTGNGGAAKNTRAASSSRGTGRAVSGTGSSRTASTAAGRNSAGSPAGARSGASAQRSTGGAGRAASGTGRPRANGANAPTGTRRSGGTGSTHGKKRSAPRRRHRMNAVDVIFAALAVGMLLLALLLRAKGVIG